MMPGETHSKPAGIASEAAGTCQNCTTLQQNLNEYVAALIALKQKIIDSDHLLTEYQQKCDELQFSERENDTLRCQLEQMLQKISPQDQNQEELKLLKTELEEKTCSLKIYQQTQMEFSRVKEECAKSDLAKKKLEVKLKKMEDAAVKQLKNFKQLMLEKKVLEKELKKTQKKLNGYQKMKHTKAIKNAQTQISLQETAINVDKSKIKLLLEELWSCIDFRGETQDDLQMLDTTLHRASEPIKERNIRKCRNLKGDECTMPPSHSSPLILRQTLTVSSLTDHASSLLNTGKNAKNKNFEEAVTDCNGDSAFYEDKTADLFVPRNCSDSYGEASCYEDKEVEEFLAFIGWSTPLPPLLSPIPFSPSTTKDLLGELTDSSEERICPSDISSSNVTMDYVNSGVNATCEQEQKDICWTQTDHLKKIQENTAFASITENVANKTTARCTSEDCTQRINIAEVVNSSKEESDNNPVHLQAESTFCPVSKIMPDSKPLIAESVNVNCTKGTTFAMQLKDKCIFSCDIDQSNCNATGTLEKPAIKDGTCSESVSGGNLKIPVLTKATNAKMENITGYFQTVQPNKEQSEFVQKDVPEMYDLVKYENASSTRKDHLDLQCNVSINVTGPVESNERSISKCDPEVSETCTTEDLIKRDCLSELLLPVERFPACENVLSHGDLDKHKMSDRSTGEVQLGSKISTELQDHCTEMNSGEAIKNGTLCEEKQAVLDSPTVVKGTPESDYIEENALCISPVLSRSTMQNDKRIQGLDSIDKENDVSTELQFKQAKTIEQEAAILLKNDQKQEAAPKPVQTDMCLEAETKFGSTCTLPAYDEHTILPVISDRSNANQVIGHSKSPEKEAPHEGETSGARQLKTSDKSLNSKFKDTQCAVAVSNGSKFLSEIESEEDIEHVNSATEQQTSVKETSHQHKKDEFLSCSNAEFTDVSKEDEQNSEHQMNISNETQLVDGIACVAEEKSGSHATEAVILQNAVKASNSLQTTPFEGKLKETQLFPIELEHSGKENHSSKSPGDMLVTVNDCLKESFKVAACYQLPNKDIQTLSIHKDPAEPKIPPSAFCEVGCVMLTESVEKRLSEKCNPLAEHSRLSKLDSNKGTDVNTGKEKSPNILCNIKDIDTDVINLERLNKKSELIAQASPGISSVLLPPNINPRTTDMNPYVFKDQFEGNPVPPCLQNLEISIAETVQEKASIENPSGSSDESEDEFPLRKVSYGNTSSCKFKPLSSVKLNWQQLSHKTLSTGGTENILDDRPPNITEATEIAHESANEFNNTKEDKTKVSQSKNLQLDKIHCNEMSSASTLSDGKSIKPLDQTTFVEPSSLLPTLSLISTSKCAESENAPLIKPDASISVNHNAGNSCQEYASNHASESGGSLSSFRELVPEQDTAVSLSDNLSSEIKKSGEGKIRRQPGQNLIWNFEMPDIADPKSALGPSKRYKANAESYDMDSFGKPSICIDGTNKLANSVSTIARRRDNRPFKSVSRGRGHPEDIQIGRAVLANADTSTKTELPPETLNNVRLEMGPPLPPLLDPLMATPPRCIRPLSPVMLLPSLASPLDVAISPLRITPVPPLMSPLSDSKSSNSPMFATPSPSEKANRRILSSPLQFCAATPKHALPVPGRLPPSAATNTTPSVQKNSVKILDTMYPELSARARTLNILKGNIQLNRCLNGDSKSNMPVNQITGFKAITSTSTAFSKTGSNSKSIQKDQPDCEIQRQSSNCISVNKRVLDHGPMPKSAKRLRLDSESPVTETIKDCFSSAKPQTECKKTDNFVSALPVDIAVITNAGEDAVTIALKKVEDFCFDLLPVIRSHIFVGSIPRIPVMRNEEKEVIHEFIGTKKSLVENLLQAILKKLKTEKTSLQHNRLQALCRVYVGLCRQLGDMERARLLCYSILKEDFPEAAKLTLFIVSTWKDLFSLNCVINKAIQALLKPLAEGEVLNCLSAYLNWEKTPPVNVSIVLSSVLMALQFSPDGKFQLRERFGEDLTDNIWEYVFAVELLCCHHKWKWTHDNVISKELWPILDKWVKRKKGNVKVAFVADIVVATVLRIVGHLCQIGLKEGFVSAVKNVSSVIVAFIQHAKEEDMPWGVQLAAVYMLFDLAPCDPAEINQSLQMWKKNTTNCIPPAVTDGLAMVADLCAPQDKNSFKY